MLTAVKSFKDLIASVPGFKVEVEFKDAPGPGHSIDDALGGDCAAEKLVGRPLQLSCTPASQFMRCVDQDQIHCGWGYLVFHATHVDPLQPLIGADHAGVDRFRHQMNGDVPVHVGAKSIMFHRYDDRGLRNPCCPGKGPFDLLSYEFRGYWNRLACTVQLNSQSSRFHRDECGRSRGGGSLTGEAHRPVDFASCGPGSKEDLHGPGALPIIEQATCDTRCRWFLRRRIRCRPTWKGMAVPRSHWMRRRVSGSSISKC